MAASDHLNPAEFGLFSRMPGYEDRSIVDYNDIHYHGTTPEAAARIRDSGFSLAQQRNGRSGGDGVYMADQPHQTSQYGPTAVEVRLRDGLRIHENPWNDETALSLAQERGMTRSLHLFGYHGYRDPDDHATVVFDPSNVTYRRTLG